MENAGVLLPVGAPLFKSLVICGLIVLYLIAFALNMFLCGYSRSISGRTGVTGFEFGFVLFKS